MIKAEEKKTIGEDKIMNKSGAGEHNELANLDSLHVWGNSENKVLRGSNNAAHTHRAGYSLLRSTGYRKMSGDSGLLSAEQAVPVEHCSQRWKSAAASSTEEQQWKDTSC